MSVRLRLGPFRVSSRGRVGVRVGPVSVYGGGHRSKRSSPRKIKTSSQAAFERRTAEDQQWFREQAAAKRWAAIGTWLDAVFSTPARMWRRRSRGTSVPVETKPPAPATLGDRAVDQDPLKAETRRDEALTDTTARPSVMTEMTGQEELVARLRIVMAEARIRVAQPPNVLLSGPLGTRNTALAKIIAHELGAKLVTTSGPVLRRPGDFAEILFSLPMDHVSVVFIDEIHRLPIIVAENLYEALEDGTLSVVIGSDNDARSVSLTLPPIVFVGATTKPSALSQQLRDRFGFHAATPCGPYRYC